MTPAGFPHSDTPGSTLGCQLPRAYRRLLRPSSALDAKASTMCPSQLVTHTTSPTHPHHNNKKPHHNPPTNRKPQRGQEVTTEDEPDKAVHTTHYKDARVHYPELKQQPHTDRSPLTRTPAQPGSWNRVTAPHPPHHPTPHQGADQPDKRTGLIPQNPNSVPPPTDAPAAGTQADHHTPAPGPGSTGTGPGKPGQAGECR